MKSFGLVIKEMHWPRLQVFMRFLVNYSYGVCVLGRVRLAACAKGKNLPRLAIRIAQVGIHPERRQGLRPCPL